MAPGRQPYRPPAGQPVQRGPMATTRHLLRLRCCAHSLLSPVRSMDGCLRAPGRAGRLAPCAARRLPLFRNVDGAPERLRPRSTLSRFCRRLEPCPWRANASGGVFGVSAQGASVLHGAPPARRNYDVRGRASLRFARAEHFVDLQAGVRSARCGRCRERGERTVRSRGALRCRK
jgi:hypothetical protein